MPQLPNSESADQGGNSSQDERLRETAAKTVHTPEVASKQPGSRIPGEAAQVSAAELPAEQALHAELSASSEREEIAKRIAAFRNLQISLKRDREDYYERTLARAHAALASNAKSPH